MTTYLPILCVFLPTLLYGAYLLIQAERRRKAAIAQRKAKRAHDEAVRKDYGYYNRASFVSHTKTGWASAKDIEIPPQVRGAIEKAIADAVDRHANEDTRPIPTIDAENTDCELSDVWAKAIDELEIEE